jgi:hypothetical protein
LVISVILCASGQEPRDIVLLSQYYLSHRYSTAKLITMNFQ